ncbi:SDR family oxidoreductase [Salinisphaera sp. USBA-960]|uniref:SDR family NAD(P)-dependent oxidoreductase n=1 Tax=Salinisphaera orenii TaxID=856731 RepID=UPI000DBE6F3A|nr:SDR family oxidoreductase [Salifodinibacter halophilus]NNC25631.1 SDR family oxidoreductase [Salifodinibacter halophilus]
MQIDLNGKTALITGSTAGIGYATALGLANAGAEVIVNGREQTRVDDAASRIRAQSLSGQIRGIAADVSTDDGCRELYEQVPHADILVNNAGVFELTDFYDIPDDDWQRFFEVNVMSGVRLARAYTPGMEQAGWGRVIFISSESAQNIPTEMIHYGMTKTAQLSISRGLAKRLAGTGVTVNAVLPGPTLSEGVGTMIADQRGSDQSLADAGADFVQSARPSSIIQRAATVDEVANMVVYTASPQASATSGAALRVDGGVVDSLM